MKIVMEEEGAGNGYAIKKALCLDLDGTVRRSKSGQEFIQGPDDIELIPGVEKLISMYDNMGYMVFGITNQGGVAWGFKTIEQVSEEIKATIDLFKTNPFAIIHACPFDPRGKVEPYNMRSLNRKPDVGSLAICEFQCAQHGVIIDWDNSLFVGDRPEDEECAKRAGILFMHIDQFLTHPHTFTIGQPN